MQGCPAFSVFFVHIHSVFKESFKKFQRKFFLVTLFGDMMNHSHNNRFACILLVFVKIMPRLCAVIQKDFCYFQHRSLIKTTSKGKLHGHKIKHSVFFVKAVNARSVQDQSTNSLDS